MLVFGGVVDINDHVRQSNIYGIWLTVPQLQEMAWQTLLRLFPSVLKIHPRQLAALGVPATLIQRLT